MALLDKALYASKEGKNRLSYLTEDGAVVTLTNHVND